MLVATASLAACSTGADGSGGSFGSSFGNPSTTASHADDDDDGGDDDDGESTDADPSGDAGGGMAKCGDGIVDPPESCDAGDLGGQSCGDFGFTDGELACDPSCNLVTDGCFTCGDGEVAGSEVCDGTDYAGQTCASLGFGGGSLQCSTDCQVIDDSGCTALPSCGDGQLDGGEQCEGGQLGGATCESQGFDLGTLGCTGSCTYDVASCQQLDCGHQGDFCLFDETNPQSTCCPAGVGENVLGICDIFICI